MTKWQLAQMMGAEIWEDHGCQGLRMFHLEYGDIDKIMFMPHDMPMEEFEQIVAEEFFDLIKIAVNKICVRV